MIYQNEGTTVHFYLAEPRRLTIPVVRFKVAFFSISLGVLAETAKLLFAFLFTLGYSRD
jgi:hypothetical protein